MALPAGRGDPVEGGAQFATGDDRPVALFDITRVEFSSGLFDDRPLDLGLFAQGGEPGRLRLRFRAPAEEDAGTAGMLLVRATAVAAVTPRPPPVITTTSPSPDGGDSRRCCRSRESAELQGDPSLRRSVRPPPVRCGKALRPGRGPLPAVSGKLSQVDGLAGHFGPFPGRRLGQTGQSPGERVGRAACRCRSRRRRRGVKRWQRARLRLPQPGAGPGRRSFRRRKAFSRNRSSVPLRGAEMTRPESFPDGTIPCASSAAYPADVQDRVPG